METEMSTNCNYMMYYLTFGQLENHEEFQMYSASTNAEPVTLKQ
jgi:hypothetical protein